MKALISPIEVSGNGLRIAQICDDGMEFEVAEPLHWVDCDNTINQSTHYYIDGRFEMIDYKVKPNKPSQLSTVSSSSSSQWSGLNEI